MDTEIKIKAMYFGELIAEIQRLHAMYVYFSNDADNVIASSAFHIVSKDLETILNKFSDK